MLSYIPRHIAASDSAKKQFTENLLKQAEGEEQRKRVELLNCSFESSVGRSQNVDYSRSQKELHGRRDTFSFSQHRERCPLSSVRCHRGPLEDSLTRLQKERVKDPKLSRSHSTAASAWNAQATSSLSWWQISVPPWSSGISTSQPAKQNFTQSLSYVSRNYEKSYSFLPSLCSEHLETDRSDLSGVIAPENSPYCPTVYPGGHSITICNLFWKSSLTFHPFTHGDRTVDFGALWPGEKELKLVLVEAYRDKEVQQLIIHLAKLALFCGPLRLLKVILQQKLIGVLHRFDDGQTLLHKASLAHNLGAVVYLTKQGLSCKVPDLTGRTADQLCRSRKIMKVLGKDSVSLYGQVITMDTGIDRFSDKVKVNPSLHDKQLIFDLAHNEKDTDELLAKLQMFEFDVNKEIDEAGDYLMHVATKQGLSHMVLLKLLKDNYAADIDLTNTEGYTCLMLASIVGSTTFVDALVCVLGANPDVKNPHTGRTALHYAGQRNELEVVSTLLKRGADYNIEDDDGARPDELAAIFRATDCHSVIQTHRTDRITQLSSLVEQDLLTSGDIRSSDLCLTNLEGYTLLMQAARHNCTNTLQLLLEQDEMPLDAQHEQTLKTALSYAAKFGHCDALELLLLHGANPTIRDMNGHLPTHSAAIHHQRTALEVLFKYPAALTGLSLGLSLSQHPSVHKLMVNAMHRRQANVVSPGLFESCTSGDIEKLYRTLEEGDNVNPVSGGGDWPMYLAAENGHLEIVKMLHEMGGDMKRRHPRTGNSVLHASCRGGHVEVTEFILAQCGKCKSQCPKEPCGMINSLNYKKETPLILAATKGNFRLVNLLLDHGATSSVLNAETGQLFVCEFEGLQYIIENHRKTHAEQIMAVINDRKALAKLPGVFRPQFDHNLRDHNGDTPLMVASRLGKVDVLRFLLQTAVYEVFPSPPSHSKLHQLCHDSDSDSGNITEANTTHQSIAGSQCPRQSAYMCSTPIPESNEIQLTGELPRRDTQRDLTCIYEDGDGAEIPGNGDDDYHRETLPRSASFYLPPESTEAEEECAIRDNISSLLDSIASVSRGSVFVNHRKVSHICAVNPRDCSTVYHRAVEGGDNISIIKALLEYDQSAVNIQDINGVSPLHRACQLGRKRIIEKLVCTPFVDVNCRTLNGMLPEEMSKNKNIISLVQKARKSQPVKSSSFSLRTSIFGMSSTWHSSDNEESIDFDELNTRFMLLKNDIGSDVGLFL